MAHRLHFSPTSAAPGNVRSEPKSHAKSGSTLREPVPANTNWCCGNVVNTLRKTPLTIGMTVQVFMVLALSILVVSTTLLFNFYALRLINASATSYITIALSQAQDQVGRVWNWCYRGSYASVSTIRTVFSEDALITENDPLVQWFVRSAVTTGKDVATDAVLLRMAAASFAACQSIAWSTAAYSAWVWRDDVNNSFASLMGGCLRPSAFPGLVSQGFFSSQEVAFLKIPLLINITSGAVTTSFVRGLSDDATRMSVWNVAVSHLASGLSRNVSDAFRWAEGTMTGTVGGGLSERSALQELPFDGASNAPTGVLGWVSTIADPSWAAAVDADNASWAVWQLASNASVTALSSTLLIHGDRRNLDRNGSARVLLSVNISSSSLADALRIVASGTSPGVVLQIWEASSGAVLAWYSSLGYFTSIGGSILVSLRNTASAVSQAGAVPAFAAKWLLVIDKGTSVVASLSEGTVVVLVVSLAIAIAICLTGSIALRLLLNPLARVRHDINRAAALKFDRISEANFPPSMLREMNLVMVSFLQLVEKLKSYRPVLMEIYDSAASQSRRNSFGSSSSFTSSSSTLSSFRDTSSSFTGTDGVSSSSFSDMSSSFAGDDDSASSFGGDNASFVSMDSAAGDASAVHANDGEDEGGTLIRPTSADATRLAVVQSLNPEFLSESFAHTLRDQANAASDELDSIANESFDERRSIRVRVAFLSRRHRGRQRLNATFDHAFRDGDFELYHHFLKDCLQNLKLSPFEEVQTLVSCNGVYVKVDTNQQLADAIAVARGELMVRMMKSSVKKVLSPVALLVDLINFVLNILLITLVMRSTLPGTTERTSIAVFCGLYCAAFIVNLGIALQLLRRGRNHDPRLRDWISASGLEVSTLLLFCALNTQHMHFLWSHWTIGLKFNCPRNHFLWKVAVQYSLFGFFFLDIMQLCYKAYRVLHVDDFLVLGAAGMLMGGLAMVLNLKKRVDFVVFYWKRWRGAGRSRRPGGQETSGGFSDAQDHQDPGLYSGSDPYATVILPQRTRLTSPMVHEEVTVVALRLCTSESSSSIRAPTFAFTLSRFFAVVFGSVKNADGTVLWFLGNDALIVFNYPMSITSSDHTVQALSCVRSILQTLTDDGFQDRGNASPLVVPTPNVRIVAALHRDVCVFGTLGSRHRKSLQCMSDLDGLLRLLDFVQMHNGMTMVATSRCAAHLEKLQKVHSTTSTRPGPLRHLRWTPHDIVAREFTCFELRFSSKKGKRDDKASSSSTLAATTSFLGVKDDASLASLRVLAAYARQTLRTPLSTNSAPFHVLGTATAAGLTFTVPPEEARRRTVKISAVEPTARPTDESLPATSATASDASHANNMPTSHGRGRTTTPLAMAILDRRGSRRMFSDIIL